MHVLSRVLIFCLAGATSLVAQSSDTAKIREYLEEPPKPDSACL